jgi:hypothetical protein
LAVDVEIALAESEEEKGTLQLRIIELEEAAANEVILLQHSFLGVFFSQRKPVGLPLGRR